MVVTLWVQLACHVLFSSPFISKCLSEQEKLLQFFFSSARRKKNLAKLDWEKHRKRNYGNKSLWDKFIEYSGKMRGAAETERQHSPLQSSSKDGL